MMTAKCLMVSVRGWMNRRGVIVEAGCVFMEIAVSRDHCPTCAQRVRDAERVLAGSGVVWDWQYPASGGVWLQLVLPDGKDPIELLRETTRLDISS